MSEPNSAKNIVIIGASHAGVTAAEALRRNGYAGMLTLISAEAALPYHRPPLSKALLSSEKTEAQIALRGEKFYADNAITLLRETRASAIDALNGKVVTDKGDLAYDRLILATGARSRRLAAAEGLAGVHYLRDIRDAISLRAEVPNHQKIVVIGGGFIGLEAAATFLKAGRDVSLVEPLPALLRRALPAETSDYLAEYHRAQGLDLHLGTTIAEVLSCDGHVTGVVLSDGTRLTSGCILVGIGSTARLELADDLQLDVLLGGIKVDEQGQTSRAGVYAIGDCATQFNHRFCDWLRIESVQIATDQARAAAAAICGTACASAAHSVPWFWSDQYDLKLQMAGFVQEGRASVLRRGVTGKDFTIFHHKDGKLEASFSVNRAGDHIQSRKAIAEGTRLCPERLQDSTLALAACRLEDEAV